ncbi:MAG: hypothetical protein Q8891_13700 [Bacteroidota bacterium]|nr:hypothetical protein [Bacteroidota bacterium]
MNTILSELSPHLFWDINRNTLELEPDKKFIIKRVLEYGLWKDWILLRKTYGIDTITKTTQGFRELDPRALAFISTLSDIPKEKFRCYTTKQSTPQHWNL